jgi:vancomycin resistance protein VanW
MDAEAVKSRLPAPARRRLGAAYRRVRREWQWRTCGARLNLATADAAGFPYGIAAHTSPILRPLSGVDMRLQHNKAANLRIALAALDGLVLEPGHRMSFWKQVGNPSERRGFLPGLVLAHGKITEGVGGGLCQLTNLLHWMTLHTPLTVVERWRHSYDVFPDAGRTVPFASGATCAWPALDLQIENRTHTRFRLSVAVVDDELHGAWTANLPAPLTYRVYEAAHVITHDGSGVYHRRNVLRRSAINAAGDLIDDHWLSDNHARMCYDPELGAGPVRISLS